MFIIPSRARPHNIRRLLDIGCSYPVLVRVDDDDPLIDEYNYIDFPENWTLEISEREKVFGEIYNKVFKDSPNLDWYGVFADDVVPQTKDWDRQLIEAAGSDGLAFGDDGINGERHAAHFVLGGDLVREMGWLALPGLGRLYIDTAWTALARQRGVLRYLPDVKMLHYHFSNGLAPMDETYRKSSQSRDVEIYNAWRKQCSMSSA